MENLSIIFSFLLGLIVIYFLFGKSSSSNNKKQTQSIKKKIEEKKKPIGPFSIEEVSKHNTRDDCWIIVKDKVYDISEYIEDHPGGDAILNNAGKDSTIGFYGPQHPATAIDVLTLYYIGEVKK